MSIWRGIKRITGRVDNGMRCCLAELQGVLCSAKSESGQGTTEYAILVGVLVVIAILAVTAFKGKIQALWTAIENGVNGL